MQNAKLKIKNRTISILVSISILVAGKSSLAEQTLKNFHFSHLEEGKKQWELTAREGEIYKEKNEIYLKDFSVKFYSEDKIVSRFTAKEGKIDQNNKLIEGKNKAQIESLKEKIKIATEEIRYSSEEKKIFSSSPLEIERNKMVIKGKGLESTPDFSQISILQEVSAYDQAHKFNVRSEKMEILQIRGIIEFKNGVKLQRENSFLNADYLCYDEKERIMEARGNAELFLESKEGEKIKINAQKITFFEKEEEIHAQEKVKIEQGKNYATGEEAHYYSREEKIFLTGGPPFVYQEEEKRKGEYQAERVIFYLPEKRISFEGNVQGVITYHEP